MASLPYVTAGSSQTVQVLSSSEVAPVQRVAIYTKPHGSRVVVNVPLAAFQAGHSDAYLSPVAATIEQVWKDGFVSATQSVQDTDPATGLLTDFVDFTVSYTPGTGLQLPFTGLVRVPVAALSSETAFTTSDTGTPYGQQIAEKYNALAKLAGR